MVNFAPPVFLHFHSHCRLYVISRTQSRSRVTCSLLPGLTHTHTHLFDLFDLGQALGADHSTSTRLGHEVHFFRDHTPQVPIDIKAALKMPFALRHDKAPGRIAPYNDQAPGSHATKVLTRKFGASQNNAITHNLDVSPATSTAQSSKEAFSSPTTASTVTVFLFFRLPPELQDEIYIYASTTQIVWMGRPPRFSDNYENRIVEKDHMYKPATLVRTKHSIISVCHQTRDEFRNAMWREYMTGPRVVHLRLYDFAVSPLEELFANCSAPEVEKLRHPDKCRVHHHITSAFHKYRQSDRAYWEIVDVLDDWMMFEWRTELESEQSIDVCGWYDARLLMNTMKEDGITHIQGWHIRWECPVFFELWDAISEAYETCSAERIVGRNAFHKLAPLGQ